MAQRHGRSLGRDHPGRQLVDTASELVERGRERRRGSRAHRIRNRPVQRVERAQFLVGVVAHCDDHVIGAPDVVDKLKKAPPGSASGTVTDPDKMVKVQVAADMK